MRRYFKILLTGFLIYLLGGFPTLLFALPLDGQIVAGQGNIQQPDANNMVINQSTGQMITNWQGFSIGSAESVTFNQPNAQSTSLNRVVGVDPSAIMGKLSANGQVFLTNPSGVIFGPGARVNVGSLLATTLKISDQDFLNRNYNFTQDAAKALSSIVNEGQINAANGGYIGLLAPTVENRGTITAHLGSVALSSGKAATLDFSGDGLINFAITEPVNSSECNACGITNSGLIQADGGQITLSAKAAGNVIRSVVNNTGIIEAKSVVQKNGRIFLMGDDAGIVENSGTLDASGDDPGEKGGTVHILGNKVGLTGSGSVDVSGDAGGGTALIGGDYQGKNASIRNAQVTYIGELASIDASAFTNGDGGKVIVWADGTTRFYGDIIATGGAVSGDGGFTEVSGKQYLDFQGNADLGAANGTGGTLLLDPASVVVGSVDSNQTGFTVSSDITEAYADDNGLTSAISAATLESVAASSGRIRLQATGNITVSSAVNITNSNVGLALEAKGTITVNADISTTSELIFFPDTDANAGTATTLTIASGITLTSTTGQLVVRGGADGGSQNIVANGSLTLNAGTSLGITQDLTAAGDVTINADSVGDGTGAFNIASGKTLDVGGNALSITAATIGNNAFYLLTLTGTSTLVLQPSTDASTIGIGGGTGTFALTDADIAAFTDGFSSITIGRSTGTGAVDQDAVTFNDPLTIQGGAMVMDNLSMGANAITLVSSSTIDDADTDATNITTTGTLTLTSSGAIGGISVLGIDVGTVTVTSSGGNNVLITDQGTSDTTYNITTGGAGNLTLTQTASNMDIGSISTTGNLTATGTAGTITDSGAITVGGTSTYTTSANNSAITLDTTTNAHTGAITFAPNGTGVVTIDNGTTNLVLAASTMGGTFTATSGGAITDSGALTITGTSSFTTDVAGSSITLDTTTNAMTGAVSFSSSGAGDVTFDNGSTTISFGTFSIGNDLSLTTDTAIDIPSLTVSGTFGVTSSGAITDSGALTITGTATFAAGSGNDITLDSSNNFSTVVITSGNNVSLTDSGAIALGTSTISGTLAVTSSGAITDSSSLTVSGTATFAAGSGNDITLDSTHNFSSVTITSGKNVTLNDTDSITLNASTISGTLSLTSGGDITLGGATTVSSTATLSADKAITINANLTSGGAMSLTANEASGGDKITLASAATLDASGDLKLTAADFDLSGTVKASGNIYKNGSVDTALEDKDSFSEALGTNLTTEEVEVIQDNLEQALNSTFTTVFGDNAGVKQGC